MCAARVQAYRVVVVVVALHQVLLCIGMRLAGQVYGVLKQHAGSAREDQAEVFTRAMRKTLLAFVSL